MVRDKQLSLAAVSAAQFPGGKYPNLFLFFLVPAMGKTVEENENEFYSILEKFKTEKVDDETLARVKTKARAGLIRQLDSNSGLASQLTAYSVAYGDWRKLFTSLDESNKVTAEDVQRVPAIFSSPRPGPCALTVQPKKQRRRTMIEAIGLAYSRNGITDPGSPTGPTG